MRKAIDMLGYEFQTWKVISQSGKKGSNNNIYWNCQCKICQAEKTFCGSEIRLGRTGRCKHSSLLKINKFQNEDTKNKRPGNVKNEINNEYGKLKVISFAYIKNSCAYWNCKCKCGTELIVRGNSLRTGSIQSCGCQRSRKEEEIKSILEKNNIEYKREFSFSDLKDKAVLRFDFAIFSNNNLIGLIEYQGQQHYEKAHVFNHYGLLQIHDQLKKDYCEKNKIPLLELNKDSDLEKEILFFIYVNQ